MKTLIRASLSSLIALAGIVALGCGGGGIGSVNGTVKHQGKTVVLGTVTAVGADGVPHSAEIAPDGTYSISDVPTGVVQFGVISHDPRVATAKGRPAAGGRTKVGGRMGADGKREAAPEQEKVTIDPALVKKWFPLPADVENVGTSKLETTIKKGPNTFDITIP